MAEWLVSRLGYAPGFRKIFATLPRHSVDGNLAVEREIIAAAERAVYGSGGLEKYETGQSSALRRAARRALAQHLCHRALLGGRGINSLRRVLFALAFPGLLMLFLGAGMGRRRGTHSGERPDLVVFFWYERLHKFVDTAAWGGQSYILHRGQGVRFGLPELWFFLRVLAACPRLIVYPELLCNVVRWLGYYGYAAGYYRPRHAVVHFFENTSACSLMTAYLHERGLRHIDVQHGEILSPSMPAFSHFDEVRLWGEYFRQLLRLGHSAADHFRVCGTRYHRRLFTTLRPQGQPRPKRLLIIDPFLYENEPVFAAIITQVLRRLDAAWEVRVRRHPGERRSRLDWMDRLQVEPAGQAPDLREELPSVPIEEALSRTRVVLGVASAALIEAWIAGCKVIHIAGGPCRQALMDRYQGSENVLYCEGDPGDDTLERFLTEPPVLDERERERVGHLVSLVEDTA